jgi:hypothetical protein
MKIRLPFWLRWKVVGVVAALAQDAAVDVAVEDEEGEVGRWLRLRLQLLRMGSVPRNGRHRCVEGAVVAEVDVAADAGVWQGAVAMLLLVVAKLALPILKFQVRVCEFV